jgi:hypothetical protein
VKVYRITPLEKKNVEIYYDVYEEKEDGTIRAWSITELYRWGLGFRTEDDPISEYERNGNGITCDPEIGSGAELDDLISVNFEFDDSFSDDEQQALENEWYDGGAAWLYDGEHDWQVDYSSLTIHGPVNIDLIDDVTGEVYEEDVQTSTEKIDVSWQTVSDQEASVWPFPIQDNFGETGKNS